MRVAENQLQLVAEVGQVRISLTKGLPTFTPIGSSVHWSEILADQCFAIVADVTGPAPFPYDQFVTVLSLLKDYPLSLSASTTGDTFDNADIGDALHDLAAHIEPTAPLTSVHRTVELQLLLSSSEPRHTERMPKIDTRLKPPPAGDLEGALGSLSTPAQMIAAGELVFGDTQLDAERVAALERSLDTLSSRTAAAIMLALGRALFENPQLKFNSIARVEALAQHTDKRVSFAAHSLLEAVKTSKSQSAMASKNVSAVIGALQGIGPNSTLAHVEKATSLVQLKRFDNFEEIKLICRELGAALKRRHLKVKCTEPGCNAPASIRCNQPPRMAYRIGFDHTVPVEDHSGKRIGTKRVFHCGANTFPEIHLLSSSETTSSTVRQKKKK